MAGTVVETREVFKGKSGKMCTKIRLAWTSDGSGNATSSVVDVFGYLIKAITNPGSAAPTDNYDVTLTDPDDATLDALQSKLVDRDTANTEEVYPLVTGAATPLFLCGTYGFSVANAGASKTGELIMYFVDSL